MADKPAPKKYLCSFRDRFSDREAVDCAFRDLQSAVRHVNMICGGLKTKVAQGFVFVEEPEYKVLFVRENDRCASCAHWDERERPITAAEAIAIEVQGYAHECGRTGTCTLARLSDGEMWAWPPFNGDAPTEVNSSADFLCVCYESKPDGPEVE